MSRYVAAYDIARNSRRDRVARILREYGRRVQRSVFEIDIDPEDLNDLQLRIGSLLARDDRFDFFPIDVRFPQRRLSWQRNPLVDSCVIVIG
ncbi:CRISPR-associated endonuclease Cas2 [Tuwongella immobilis]|uniref:CRISPR-associated endoribonuclease Cas2 n=1 Tax=Tuwongella immobilis TaxID=692036 RepID=A0A6C2YS95_9BACT|nr:CRISPR-associated endonuclease Cas2 [Tuwongella immobilis]VIP04003.1 crispr-associated protein cas2 : CRISPR-associated endoribonuclease Cas2 OS=Pirellula staleyi (strain ATCC 27377 / DSM 6068 / ICPB 4128) GN=cas2 PE=3 SV=1: CRISPR_Cas2 [Tuwongella immobilis]VTS05373.1 crispr-associated protein cas2 : CRISPR-associated endoribonuclease Cas2 OS=Pirellula staleyi (strain ATCC 27377 / DSM 6068 / ICPB 4128) GN=cas2 PE=3 SV=1: CRISPR_Cas2 [Tuwongella immobilis]